MRVISRLQLKLVCFSFYFPHPYYILTSVVEDWTLLTAGSIVNSTISDARDVLLSTVHARSFMKTGQNANPSTYSAIDGSLINGTASPAMGAAFAFLALG